MKWTNKTPTELGFYWLAQKGETGYHKPLIVSLFEICDKYYVAFAGEPPYDLSLFDNHGDKWFGPLQIPDEQEEPLWL